MDALAEAHGNTSEVLLRKVRPFLVRAVDKSSGELVVGGEVHSILDFSVDGKVDKFSSRVASSFDAIAGGYNVEASRFNTRPGGDEYLVFAAPGYDATKPVLVSKSGVWIAGDSIELELTRK